MARPSFASQYHFQVLAGRGNVGLQVSKFAQDRIRQPSSSTVTRTIFVINRSYPAYSRIDSPANGHPISVTTPFEGSRLSLNDHHVPLIQQAKPATGAPKPTDRPFRTASSIAFVFVVGGGAATIGTGADIRRIASSGCRWCWRRCRD